MPDSTPARVVAIRSHRELTDTLSEAGGEAKEAASWCSLAACGVMVGTSKPRLRTHKERARATITVGRHKARRQPGGLRVRSSYHELSHAALDCCNAGVKTLIHV